MEEIGEKFTRHQFFLHLTDEQFESKEHDGLLNNWLRGIADEHNLLIVLLIMVVEVVFDKKGAGVVYRLWIDL